MPFSTILYNVEDNILTITLNRPAQLNAFNPQENPKAAFAGIISRMDRDD